ncbi:DUF4247 domain-containing protein [Longispora urticae]
MRKWYVFGGIAAVLALVLGGIAVFGSATSPRGYVSRSFTRSAVDDVDGSQAYRSTKAPAAVAAMIRGGWKPAEEFADASGYYLRYSDDVVAVFPRGSGSLIRVEDSDRAYRRYHSHVGGYWGFTTGQGEAGRGGGPGSGK